MQTPLWEEEAQIRRRAAIVLHSQLLFFWLRSRCRKRFAREKYIIHGSVLPVLNLGMELLNHESSAPNTTFAAAVERISPSIFACRS
jgi:hypothetical protein